MMGIFYAFLLIIVGIVIREIFTKPIQKGLKIVGNFFLGTFKGFGKIVFKKAAKRKPIDFSIIYTIVIATITAWVFFHYQNEYTVNKNNLIKFNELTAKNDTLYSWVEMGLITFDSIKLPKDRLNQILRKTNATKKQFDTIDIRSKDFINYIIQEKKENDELFSKIKKNMFDFYLSILSFGLFGLFFLYSSFIYRLVLSFIDDFDWKLNIIRDKITQDELNHFISDWAKMKSFEDYKKINDRLVDIYEKNNEITK